MANTPQNVSPEAQNLADRVSYLNNGLGNWMHPVLQTQLAASGMDVNTLGNTAETMKNVLNNTASPVDKAYSDPALNNPQTIYQKALGLLHSTHGPVPFLPEDITGFQQSLQAKGYGKNLTPGAWNSGWQTQLNQYNYDKSNKPGVGNTNSFSVFHSILSDLAPSGWLPTVTHAVASYIHSLPGQLRQVVSDVAGGATGIALAPFNKSGMGNVVAANIAKDLGDKSVTSYTDPKTGEHHLYIPDSEMTKRAIQDLGNVFTLIGGASLAKGAFSAVGAIGKGIAEQAGEEATAGGLAKALAKNPSALVTRSLPESFAATPRYTFVKGLYQTTDAGASGLLSRFADNPVMSRILPFIDANAENKSVYFTARDAIGQTMRIPGRQAFAVAQAKGSLAALGLLGTGEAEKALGATPTFDATKVAPYSGVLGNALDVLGAVAGAPTHGLKASESAGSIIGKAHTAISQALGPINFDKVIESALPGIKYKELENAVGPEMVNDHFINTKIPQYAAAHAAQQALDTLVSSDKIDRASEEYTNKFQQFEHEIINNPELLQKATDSLVAQPHVLANAYKKDFTNAFGLNFKKNGLAVKDKQAFFDSLNQLKNVYQEMPTLLSPEHRNLLYGSATNRMIEDLRSAALSQEWASNSNKFDQEFSQKLGLGAPRFWTIDRNVNEYAPDANKMVKNTPYGSGIIATTDPKVAGRANANIYNVTHQVPASEDWERFIKNEAPKFADLTTQKNAPSFYAKMKTFVKRDEIGLPPLGVKNPDKSLEATALQKALRSKSFETSPQKLIDMYRNAMISAGNNKDVIDSRVNQLMNEYMKENDFAGVHYGDAKYGPQTIIRPDRAQVRMVAKDPSMAKDPMLASYLTHTNTNGLGTIGVARKETFTAQDALKTSNKFFDEIKALGYGDDVDTAKIALEQEGIAKTEVGPLPRMKQALTSENPKLIALTNQMRDILVSKFHYDLKDLTRLDPIQLASRMRRDARTLASEAYIPNDAPQALQDAIKRLDAAGYKPVLGTDIGHGYELPRVLPSISTQRTSMLRRAAMRLGADTTNVSDIDVSIRRRQNVADSINNVLSTITKKNGVQPILGDTGNAIYARLLEGAQRGDAAGLKMTRMERYQYNRALNKVNTDNMTQADIDALKTETQRAITKQHNDAHSIRDLSLKQMTKILTRPIDTADITGTPIPGYTPEDAMKIAKAVLRGYAATPTSYAGFSKAEDFFRASGSILSHHTASFFGQVPVVKNFNIGNGHLFNSLASLPNELIRWRDKVRFDLSPVFSAERVVKTNLKAATQGVPATLRPYQSLEKLGKVDEAFNILNRTMPEVYKATKATEPLDKFLLQNDVWNIYNPGHNMAWQAWNLAKQGLSDEEINAKLIKINTYGDRTPLERTINTIFYPFSFNKSLYSNLGGQLLDHPTQALLLNHALSLYQHYNKNNELTNWVDQHAPVLKELYQLNAFRLGVGVGELGGINAPYINEFVNMFMPQVATPSKSQDVLSAMTKFVPAAKLLNNLIFNYQPSTGSANFQGSAVETAKVGWWAMRNAEQHAADLISGHRRDVYQPMMTEAAQTNAGIQLSTALKAQLSNVLGTGAVFPNNPAIPEAFQGKKIDATTIGQLVNHYYPAYDESKGAQIALEKTAQANNYVNSLAGTPRYTEFSQFQTVAQSILSKLAKSKDPASIQAAVQPLRGAAVMLAEQDAQFVRFYNKYYQSYFGPIEGFVK